MALALSPNQQLFVTALAKQTGLNPDVVAAWVRNEEPAQAATVGQNDQNWLNIGNVDSGGRNEGSQWSNPTSAAQVTAEWMKGNPNAVPGYGAASGGIQNILKAGSNPAAEIKAIQDSGWASGGETALPLLYSQDSGQKITAPPLAKAASVPAASVGTTLGSSGLSTQGLAPASTGPKGSDLLSMFGTQDATSDPSASATWNGLSSLLKAKGQ